MALLQFCETLHSDYQTF